MRRGSDYDTDKTVSTHQDRQAFLDFLGQPELLPLLGEDVGGVGADVGAESAHQAHDDRAGSGAAQTGQLRPILGAPPTQGSSGETLHSHSHYILTFNTSLYKVDRSDLRRRMGLSSIRITTLHKQILSSPSPKSGPLRPKPKPKAVPNQSPIGIGLAQ